MLLGVWKSVREWTPTLPSELLLWELASRWSPKSPKSNCKGQNPLNKKFPYIIEKLLELRCLKWVRMTHLDTSNISYGQKKSRESNWQSNPRPLKVRNRPNFLACRWCATSHWKAPYKGYNFAMDFTSVATLLWPSVGVKPNTWKKVRIWSPPELLNVQSSTARPKTPCIGVFLVSFERSWSVNIENGLALAIWTSVAQVMGKRRAGS
jgi:hypothetical protein